MEEGGPLLCKMCGEEATLDLLVRGPPWAVAAAKARGHLAA